MGKQVRIIDRETKKSLHIRSLDLFSRLPMIDECLMFCDNLYKITMVLHGIEEDCLFVELIK